MCSVSLKAGPSRKPRSCSENFPEQIRISFVYHPMRLLILGVIAIVMLGVASGTACIGDADGYRQWRNAVRESALQAKAAARDAAREAREAAREAGRQARESEREAAREVHEAQREALRAQRDAARAPRDWGYTY
jgi:hypothetical protein